MTVVLLRWVGVLSFFVHVICMNLTLGGAVLAGCFRLFSREGAPGREIAVRLSHQLPVTLSATLLTGLLPLLARAELFGRYGYGAYVVAELPWVSIILLVLAASYGLYLFDNRSAAAWALGSALAVAAIVFFFSSHLFLASPAEWPTPDGSQTTGIDRASIPRYLHFFVGALSVGSAWAVWLGLTARDDLTLQKFALVVGGRLFAIFTTIELAVGSCYIAYLPVGSARRLLGGDVLGTAFLVVALGFSVASVALLLRAPRAPEPRRTALSGLLALGATLFFMTLVRERLRDFGARPAAIGAEGSAGALLLVFVVIPVAAALLLAFIYFREGRNRHADATSSDLSEHASLGRR